MSKKFKLVKMFYDRGPVRGWSIKRVRNAVKCKWITADEFEIITGKNYKAEKVK